MLVVIAVERQWVIAVQYRFIFRRDGLFPGGTKEHTKKLKFNIKAHTTRMRVGRHNTHISFTCDTKLPAMIRQKWRGRPCRRATWWPPWRRYRGFSTEGGEGEVQVQGHRHPCSPGRNRDQNHPPGPQYRRTSCCSWECNQTLPHLSNEMAKKK